MDRDFGNWFAGFVDGEGCFTILKVNGTYVPAFYMCLREDDSHILEDIQKFVGYGKFSRNKTNQITYYVNSRDGIARLVEIFDEFPLRAKKRNCYAIWRQAVMEKNSVPRYTRNRDWSKMINFKTKLTEVKALVN